jgi:hypothetical protein
MNTIKMHDQNGGTDFMVRVPKFKLSEVIAGASDTVHPAFIVNGKEVDEIYISKYQNTVCNGTAYSLPYQRPAANITYDAALEACRRKGEGWHLMSNAEWAAIALWCLKNGTVPRGNTNRGKHHVETDERGLTYDGYDILTGTGPAKWAHDHTEDGIYDLVGNVWEWVSGLRVLDGKIQIIPDNNAVTADHSKGSSAWENLGNSYRIDEDGITLTTDDDITKKYKGCYFKELRADCGIVQGDERLQALGLIQTTEDDVGYFWVDNNGERIPLRGGSWNDESSAGVFALGLSSTRSGASAAIGFRSAFVNLKSAD